MIDINTDNYIFNMKKLSKKIKEKLEDVKLETVDKTNNKNGYFKYKIIRNIQEFNNFKFRENAIYYFNNLNTDNDNDLLSYYIDYSDYWNYDIIDKFILDNEDTELKNFIKFLKTDKTDYNIESNKYLGSSIFKNNIYILDIITILLVILITCFIHLFKNNTFNNVYILSGILILITIGYVFFSILLYN
tara:strand:+ start:587 stop:1153 length:567 start_codon:yes stop_codon:yes gene_type:complete